MAPLDATQYPAPKSQELNGSSLLTSEEWDFIEKISDLFPERVPSILKRFCTVEQIEPRSRLKHANEALKTELRRGFVQRMESGITPETSYNDIENIHQHSKNMRLLLRRIFHSNQNHEALQTMGPEKAKDMLKKSFRLAAVHDLAEALTTDFTPLDMKKITRDDKSRLEDLAVRILFEAFPKKHKMIEKYEKKDRLKDERNIDHLNKVVDLLEGGVDCLAMNVSEPCFDEWMETIEVALRKYEDLSLCFAAKSLNDIRSLRPYLSDLVNDFPDVQERRVAIMDIVFGRPDPA